MMTTRRRRTLPAVLASAAAAAVLLAGCSTAESTDPATPATGTSASSTAPASPSAEPSSSASESADPVAGPSRIVAMTTETADMVLLLAGPQNVAAIAASSQSPAMGMVPDLAREVPDTLPPGVEPDPEQILSYEPDLVVTTSRHGGEQSANEQLAAAGVPMLTFEAADFNTPEAYAQALRTTGEALGRSAEAEQYASELLEKIGEIDATASGASPSVLVLMARGGNVMAMGSDNMVPGLALRAGATDAAAAAGISSTGPIDAELLVRANPDIILLEDFQGSGEAPFEALLSSPAVADVPAVANQDVHLVAMTEASALSGINTPVGYQKIRDIVSQ